MGSKYCWSGYTPISEGPKVLEVNSSPGLQGIESTNNINVASLIIDYLEKKLGLSKFAKL